MANSRDKDVQDWIREEFRRAYDFDRRDPLFGLSRADLRGPRMSRRAVFRLMAAAGTLTLPGVMAACTAANTTESGAAPQPAMDSQANTPTGGVLGAGWAGVKEFTTLDPAQINSIQLFQISSNIFGGLTHINADLVAEGDLATDWDVSADGLEWTFSLRQGVTFHNGDPFSADDVVYTFQRSRDPAQSIQTTILANVADVRKDDDYTVTILLSQPQASLLIKTLERSSGRAMTIVSQGALETMGTSQYGLTPVGTGPFKVVEHQIGQKLVLERFENYYDPARPKLDQVTILPIPEPEPLAAALEAGDIQLIGGNPPAPELIDRFLSNPDLIVSEITGPGFQALWINPHREPFTTPDFNRTVEELKQEPGYKTRLAIAQAIDRQDLIERGLFGRGMPAYGSINPAMRFFFDPDIDAKSLQRFDRAAAQQSLAEAGYPDGQGFPPVKLLVAPTTRREGEIIVNMLKNNLNIDVQLEVKDLTIVLDSIIAMDFDMARYGSGGDYDPDDALVDWMITEARFNGPNRDPSLSFGYYSDQEADALINQQATTSDQEERKRLVQEANLMTSNKVVTIFLYHPQDILVYRKEVTVPDTARIPGLVDLDQVSIAS
ncbi:MAG: ABC transporter substrate-binding protein [Chloroflexales bacterium]|nr:ABC transporter substrate-binding protein [Chloroflexales bacterium]